MRYKILAFISLCFISNLALAKCYYIPCNPQITSAENAARSKIESSFDAVDLKLEALKQSYQERLDALKEQNEILSKQIALSKESLRHIKEILFLLKGANALKSNAINQESLKE
ncbi:hypothetical protein [Helicobacter turcicus]|uniref:Periplasmic protein n=1 Tax=Helicobacter turcicus TaxID=2867412 RepID=A0ABS7JPB7_9HELI|nr:hypothetical protein [Helicobacter turcicus]MBX7491217.1 hypothetical protein [Helicobacter turcicus]MBX7546144.1 hypothetical protein [Helicobacter turcicus]